MAIDLDADKSMEKMLQHAVRTRMEAIVDEAVKQAQKTVEMRAKEALPQILVAVHSRFSAQVMGRELVIRVELDDKRK
jgi:hypothetical protein